MKFINKIGDFFTFLSVVFLVGIWLNGAYHGSRRHSVEPFDFGFGFLECFYFGVERFWHPINEGELNDYIKLSTSIIINSEPSLNTNQTLEIVKSKKTLSKYLSKSTKEEYSYIKDGTYSFLMYLKFRHKDLLQELNSRKKISLKTSKTTQYYSKLSCKKGMRSEIININNYYKKLAFGYNQILEAKDYETIKNRRIFISNSNSYYKSIITLRKKVFQNLFVE
jgi:hypothetical protein